MSEMEARSMQLNTGASAHSSVYVGCRTDRREPERHDALSSRREQHRAMHVPLLLNAASRSVGR
jgi:hypothetical protein